MAAHLAVLPPHKGNITREQPVVAVRAVQCGCADVTRREPEDIVLAASRVIRGPRGACTDTADDHPRQIPSVTSNSVSHTDHMTKELLDLIVP